ncbi:MAG: hypothetical protein IIY70_05105 [Oscillospiraceae bacterium]|nr:hypothetical protein [Oscillospiraceae bacterium]
MKKVIWTLIALGALGSLNLLPFRARDVAGMLPVKTVFITRSGEEYTVDVGAGVEAVGKTISEALEQLQQEAPEEIFLPTAEQIVLTDPDEEAVEAVARESAFRPAAGVCKTNHPKPDAEALGNYLEAHPSDYTILDLQADLLAGTQPAIPLVCPTDGGFRFGR